MSDELECPCSRCGEREAYGGLSINWELGPNVGAHTESEVAWVCQRCAGKLLDAWDALVVKARAYQGKRARR